MNWIFSFLFIIACIEADPIFSQLLYQDVPNNFCSRYYHRNGGIGCRTPLNGVTGVLLAVSSTEQIFELEKGSKWDSIILFVNSTDLTCDLVMKAMSNDFIKGVTIFGTVSPKNGYSPYSKTPFGSGTPTANISLHSDYIWNPIGCGSIYADSSKPMIHIRDEATIRELTEKALKNQQGQVRNPFIMDLTSYMGPDIMDTPTCIRKGACVPLGGQSVWSIAGEADSRLKVLVATAMDSLTDFYEDRGDSLNAGIRVSVLLAVADALSSLNLSNASYQLMIAFFEGENWGRIGSRSYLADIQDFHCLQEVSRHDSPFNDRMCTSPLRISLTFTNITLEQFHRVIVLDQLLPIRDSLYIHSEEETLSTFHADIDIVPSSVSMLPPGPGETFFMAGINTVVISGFDAEFRTRSFGSALQEGVNLNDTMKVAQTVASYLANELNLDKVPVVNTTYLNSLLGCLATNGVCNVIEDVLSMEEGYITNRLEGRPLDMSTTALSAGRYPLLSPSGQNYVVNYTGTIDPQRSGVYFTPSILESFLQNSLTLWYHSSNSNQTCQTWRDCRHLENGYCIKGECYASHAYFHNAIDPGFILTGVQRFAINDHDYDSPLFTEPYWGGYYGEEPSAQVYQKISAITEWVTFAVGVVLTIVAWILTQYVFSTYGSQLKLNKYTSC